jgi:hypothetical protein
MTAAQQRLGMLASIGLVVALGVGDAVGQASGPTIADLLQAQHSVDYTAVQLRRFRDDKGDIIAVRERIEVAANGTSRPRFAVTFLGVEGELPGSPLHAAWQQTYHRFGQFFFTHGTFRVRNALSAGQNYSLHDFGDVVRAGRAARRLVVFPSLFDKAMWVVDVDAQTRVPLFAAEFDSHLTLLSEVEAISFTPSVGPLPAGQTTTLHSDFQSARAAMGNPPQMIDPVIANANDYHLDCVEVQVDPLNGQQRLTMTYTDGIDQFIVVQSPGARDVFAGIPGRTRTGHMIARYRDPAMSALLFWEGGVAFHVAGRGSMRRLDDVARRLYLQAIATH